MGESTLHINKDPTAFPGLRAARIGWVLLALLATGILLTSLPGYLLQINSGLPGHGPLTESSQGYVYLQAFNTAASLASALLSFSLAVLLFQRKFENPAVAAISYYLLLYSILMAGPLEAWGAYWLGNNAFVITAQTLLMAAPTLAVLVLFPNGRFVPGWARWILVISLPWSLFALLFPVVPYQEDRLISLLILALSWLGLLSLGIYTQIYRYRHVSTPDERQQTKWVLYGFALWFGYLLFSTYPYFYITSLPPGMPLPRWSPLSELGWWLSLNIVPLALAIAVTRSRLWNIDIVINRTLVYGALTLATVVLYIFIVGTVGNILQIGNTSFVAFLTTGLVAVLFQPLRDRLQKWVNHLMYGERDDPIAVLSRLGEELEHTGSPEDALASITKTVAMTLKLPYVAIELGDDHEIAASFGIPKSNVQRLPMLYQTETSGYLVVARRSEGEAFSLNEHRLLENIAHQAGAAAHAARLTADLRNSRLRIVSAREEERRRIRRDLHDGLGPQLASQTLTLSAARRLLISDPGEADELLQEAIKHAQAATEDIRRVVYDLRPPALDDLGLVGTIRIHAQRVESDNLKIELNLPDHLPPLPAAVEVACYMIFQEALNNVIRHANATRCTITLRTNGTLELEIRDNGIGIGAGRHTGVGLTSMRQRAEELGGAFKIGTPPGGGTRLLASLPAELEEG